MSERTHLDDRLDSLIDFATIESTEVAENGTPIATIVGAGPVDLEGADDEEVERIANCDIWGDAAVLSRPADPTDDGQCEAMMVRGGDTRELIGTKDRRWQAEHTLEPGEVVLRWCGDLDESGVDGPELRPYAHARGDGTMRVQGVTVELATDDGTIIRVQKNGEVHIKASTKVTIDAPTVNLTGDAPADKAALASKVNDRLDALELSLDAYCGGVPVPNDGGAALQTAVRATRLGSLAGTPTAPNDVSSTKVHTD